MNDVKSQIIDSDLQSLKPWNTLWALWILFFHSQKPQLRYVPIEVLSNQASKKPRTINNALKMHRTFFFIRFMTSRMNYSLLFMLIKINVKKRDKFFSYKTSSSFSSPPLWKPIKTKGHLMTYFHQRSHCQTQEQIISFPRKKITELQDFKSKLF
jgi:hypothetical protein